MAIQRRTHCGVEAIIPRHGEGAGGFSLLRPTYPTKTLPVTASPTTMSWVRWRRPPMPRSREHARFENLYPNSVPSPILLLFLAPLSTTRTSLPHPSVSRQRCMVNGQATKASNKGVPPPRPPGRPTLSAAAYLLLETLLGRACPHPSLIGPFLPPETRPAVGQRTSPRLRARSVPKTFVGRCASLRHQQGSCSYGREKARVLPRLASVFLGGCDSGRKISCGRYADDRVCCSNCCCLWCVCSAGKGSEKQ